MLSIVRTIMYASLNRAAGAEPDFAPYERLPGNAGCGLILVADHARNALPAQYGALGLEASEFERHIAYDIGIEAVLRGLCERLQAPGVMACFSRLLIDANRGLKDPTLIMQISDGAVVPGNVGLSVEEREARIARYHAPYHAHVGLVVDEAIASGVQPVLVSLHSFTPMWRGRPRVWEAGVLWDGDDRLARPLINRLTQAGFVTGDNEPYAGGLEGDTMNAHGTKRGLCHALIEIRQDLIADKPGQEAWAQRLAQIIPQAMMDAGLKKEIG